MNDLPLFRAAAVDLNDQAQAVLRHLHERGSLTEDEGRVLTGARRIAPRICEIRKAFGKDYVRTVKDGHTTVYALTGRAA